MNAKTTMPTAVPAATRLGMSAGARSLALVGVLVARLASGQIHAQDPDSAPAVIPSEQDAIEKCVSLGSGVYQFQYASLGPGVYQLQKENMALKSCMVVGQAKISTLLGVKRGLIAARRNALRRAEKEFIKWIKANAKAVEYSGQEEIIYLEDVVGGQLKGTSKSIETSREAIASGAEKAVRGLQVLSFNQDEKTGIYTTVLSWSPANASLGGKPGIVNEAEHTAESGESASQGTMTGGVPNEKIDSKTVVSGNAGDFLKKNEFPEGNGHD